MSNNLSLPAVAFDFSGCANRRNTIAAGKMFEVSDRFGNRNAGEDFQRSGGIFGGLNLIAFCEVTVCGACDAHGDKRSIHIHFLAQAAGAMYKGKYVGTFGDCGCFSFQYHKTITAGEGGMILTNDQRLYDRCCSYHDTAACWRPDRFAEQRYEGELFCGSNFRMSELTGAVMLAQLGKLDRLNAAMRKNQHRIIEQIKETKGIKVRPCHDPEGDAAICLMFFLDSSDKVAPFVEALNAEGVAAASVFNSGIPDWHIYAHWKHVIQEKAPTEVKCPYDCPYHQKAPKVEYDENMNPRTLEYLSRVVHLDIPPQMSEEDCNMIAKAINKVAAVLA